MRAVRIATWNVNSLAARMPRVIDWLGTARPDVLCLQETKLADSAFPRDAFAALGYESATHGGGRWNGVAIVSSTGIADVERGFAGEPGNPEVEARAMAATCSGVRIWSLYVPNGRAVETTHFAYKLAWLQAFAAAAGAGAGTAPRVVCGDFNIAPTDDDVWDPAEFVGSTHVTPEERDALQRLLATGLNDVMPRAFKGRPFTYWDYRAGNFHKGLGMRIDLMLLSSDLVPRIRDAYIDRDTRKGHLPSDHAAVVVDIDLQTANTG